MTRARAAMRSILSPLWLLALMACFGHSPRAHEPVYCEITLRGLIDRDRDNLPLRRLDAAQVARLIDAEAIASLTSTADIAQVFWMPATGDSTYVVAFAFDRIGCGVGSAFVSVDRFQTILGGAP